MNAGFAGLRVLLVGPVPPPHGGMANQTIQLAGLLRREGAVVDLVQVNAPYRPRWVGRVPLVRAGFRLLPFLGRLRRAMAQADVVHVMASSGWIWHLGAAPAIWIAARRRVPVVLNYRGGGAGEFFRRSMRWIRPSLARCTAIIVPSAFLQRVFAAHGFEAEIVPNIVNLDRFAPEADPDGPVRREADAPHLVVTRNLEPVYDIETALRAFTGVRERIPAARLSIAGSGPSRAPLEALAADLGVERSVEFTGRLENEAIAALYRRADLLLNPSLADNMPISILEALASGVPVVSTDVGGIPDLVENGVTALLVPPRDPAAMAQAALDLLTDPPRRQAQASAGLEHVRRYTWERVRPALLAAYEGAIRRR